MTYENVTLDELYCNAKIPFEVVATEEDIYWHTALDMLFNIEENEKLQKPTVFIVPVGPIGHYAKLIWLCRKKNQSLKNVWFINMDEYLTDDGVPIPTDHPLSFTGFMNRVFYDVLEPELGIPLEQRIVPQPGREHIIEELIDRLGGVDVSYGGIGINGHIAFNEPPEPGQIISDEDFAALGTRVLELSCETRVINSVTAASGYIDYMPRLCVTVGMKDILRARKVRFYLNRQWQKGIVRKILLGDVTPAVPASFFQRHADAKLIMASYVAQPPLGQLG